MVQHLQRYDKVRNRISAVGNKKDGSCYADVPGVHANRWKGAPQAHNRTYPSDVAILIDFYILSNFFKQGVI